VTTDHAEAVRWFRNSAEQGNAYAAVNLGTAFERGIGMRKDPAAAVFSGEPKVRPGEGVVAIGIRSPACSLRSRSSPPVS
jgi:hypothetical protein